MNAPGSPIPPHDTAPRTEAGCELMLLPDGRILAHHLTPELAALIERVFPKPVGTPPGADTLPPSAESPTP